MTVSSWSFTSSWASDLPRALPMLKADKAKVVNCILMAFKDS